MSRPDLDANPAEPGDPGAARDAAPQPFGPLVGPLFWIVIVFSLICIAAGALVGLAGPSLFSGRPAAAAVIRPWQAAPRPLHSAP